MMSSAISLGHSSQPSNITYLNNEWVEPQTDVLIPLDLGTIFQMNLSQLSHPMKNDDSCQPKHLQTYMEFTELFWSKIQNDLLF